MGRPRRVFMASIFAMKEYEEDLMLLVKKAYYYKFKTHIETLN